MAQSLIAGVANKIWHPIAYNTLANESVGAAAGIGCYTLWIGYHPLTNESTPRAQDLPAKQGGTYHVSFHRCYGLVRLRLL